MHSFDLLTILVISCSLCSKINCHDLISRHA
jgi:hypothetical protein